MLEIKTEFDVSWYPQKSITDFSMTSRPGRITWFTLLAMQIRESNREAVTPSHFKHISRAGLRLDNFPEPSCYRGPHGLELGVH